MYDEILHRSWLRLEQYFHIKNGSRVFNSLKDAYSEHQRAYHTLQHLSECLQHFGQVKNLLEDQFSVELALWFHDAVYDPKASDNEERSVQLLIGLLKDDLSPQVLIKISKWIVATKQHLPSHEDDLNMLLDIDLAILGAQPQRFLEYEQQIQQEYDWVEPAIYQIKRKQVLAHFYHQSPLYQTHFFQQNFETQAKENLKLAIDGKIT